MDICCYIRRLSSNEDDVLKDDSDLIKNIEKVMRRLGNFYFFQDWQCHLDQKFFFLNVLGELKKL